MKRRLYTLYKCRKCGFTVEAETEPESCPACGRMFYDVFTSCGIATYGIMENLTARVEAEKTLQACHAAEERIG